MSEDLYISKITVDGVTYKLRDEATETAITNIEQGNFSSSMLLSLLKVLYPVGSTFISESSSRPFMDIDSGGEIQWTLIAQGRALVGVDPNSADTNLKSSNKSFGRSDSINVSHSHTASVTVNSGGGGSTGSAGSHSHYSNNGTNYRFISHNASSIDAECSGYLSDGPVEFPRIPKANAYGSSATTAAGGAHSHSVSAHSHSASASVVNSGSSGAGQNYQPSYTMYIWKRTG